MRGGQITAAWILLHVPSAVGQLITVPCTLGPRRRVCTSSCLLYWAHQTSRPPRLCEQLCLLARQVGGFIGRVLLAALL